MVEEATQPWYKYPINIPYGNKEYDVLLGGSHDLCVETPLSTPITALLAGTITDISSPSWGHQVCLRLDHQWKNQVSYMAYLHLGTVNPALKVGSHVNGGDLLGYSGGANHGSFNTPFGPGLINAEFMSSQPQTGVALMNGPIYGTGAGWDPLNEVLDPTDIVKAGPVLPVDTEEANETPAQEESEETKLEGQIAQLLAQQKIDQDTITMLKAGPDQAHINAIITAIDVLKAALEKLVR